MTAKTALSAVALAIGLSLLVVLVYMLTGRGVICLFHLITGWDCPFCGGTRAGVAFLHGDFATAWNYNGLALIGFAILAVRSVGWVVEWIKNPRATQGKRWFSGRWKVAWWVSVAVACVAYTVVRNLV
jgi:hypothetical protein